MNQFKREQVVMLPTNNTVNALKGYSDKSLLFKYSPEYKSIPAEIKFVSYFHLYIISDDEIKKGDWKYCTNKKMFGQDLATTIHTKKIIATTDRSLQINTFYKVTGVFDGGLPQPSQQFIEKYIEEYNKGNIITDVLVEYETLKTTANNKHFGEGHIYSITNKLKINPKDNTITIKKLKDSWNREEVSNLIKLFANNYQYASNDIGYNKWIEENL